MRGFVKYVTLIPPNITKYTYVVLMHYKLWIIKHDNIITFIEFGNILQPPLQRFENIFFPWLEMCKYSVPWFCEVINPFTDTFHSREHICTLLSTLIYTSHNLLIKNTVKNKNNWTTTWTLPSQLKVILQTTPKSMSFISLEIIIRSKSHIKSSSRSGYIFTLAQISSKWITQSIPEKG